MTERARKEKRISKTKALALFDLDLLDTFEVGTFKGLSAIHRYLFKEIYDFAGTIQTVNIAQGGFRVASPLYLETALAKIDAMRIR